MDGSGKRFNNEKVRYGLVPVRALTDVANVFSFGANKYGDYNWQRGMKWSVMLESLERHLQRIKMGLDHDEESGMLHVSHLITNALMLNEYYHTFPQGDDRLRFSSVPEEPEGSEEEETEEVSEEETEEVSEEESEEEGSEEEPEKN